MIADGRNIYVQKGGMRSILKFKCYTVTHWPGQVVTMAIPRIMHVSPNSLRVILMTIILRAEKPKKNLILAQITNKGLNSCTLSQERRFSFHQSHFYPHYSHNYEHFLPFTCHKKCSDNVKICRQKLV